MRRKKVKSASTVVPRYWTINVSRALMAGAVASAKEQGVSMMRWAENALQAALNGKGELSVVEVKAKDAPAEQAGPTVPYNPLWERVDSG